MARHRGVSGHTNNERLRDGRRKMSASSSREAARQLREIEGRHPEILRDKALGEAAAAPGMEEMTASAGTRRMDRSSGWIAGGLFMSFSLALQIGRASCRERGCQYVKSSVVAVSLQRKHDRRPTETTSTETDRIRQSDTNA